MPEPSVGQRGVDGQFFAVEVRELPISVPTPTMQWRTGSVGGQQEWNPLRQGDRDVAALFRKASDVLAHAVWEISELSASARIARDFREVRRNQFA